uniref:Uncharacterized protein n=1 Tax=Candidatus Kentrum sp. FM TaxID=2126340 RepID=A0A450TXA5_9GAMM|nr:MAG: hypothetical protein BECKFM1743C_GA0114222_102875 [Candidatus Kentron sp. FM]VFJ73934.1 MAG: hypothetical protein BECKFM1743A_GA0114220_107472 [Candidatus Kentron sp. FM]VFK13621.1 MAG: hypothetical protein BECKFM1743B_GA0114221_102882 [Candidatus Kentron sp. FM]
MGQREGELGFTTRSPRILENIASYPRFPSLRTPKVISVKEYTSLLVLLPSFLHCNDSYIVHYTPVIAPRS